MFKGTIKILQERELCVRHFEVVDALGLDIHFDLR